MNPDKPAIPPKVRTVTYFVLLGGAALALAVNGLAAIWLTDVVAGRVADTADVFLAVLALLAGGLGVTYRPTKPGPTTGTQRAQDGR